MATNISRRQAYEYGLLAEKLAAWYLRCKGYHVLAERYRNHMGEIDLLVVRGKTLVAVEVKARRDMEACHDTITCQKQQKITRTMQAMLSEGSKMTGLADIASHNIRFDVVWMAPWCWPKHIVDAWRA